LFVTKQDEVEDLDADWIRFLLDSYAAKNSPRDLLGVDESETMLTLSFESYRGMYYAMGALDRQGISSYKPGIIESMNNCKCNLFDRRLNNKIFVKALDPSKRVDEVSLQRHMNFLGDLRSVCVKDNGRYAFLSYGTIASVYYTVGFFEGDTFYVVQVKTPVPQLTLRLD